jgi:2-(1,2-epoxy-1,2-dihydrophenyl)acetyl-CoA isomerase
MHYQYFDCEIDDGVATVSLLGSDAPTLRDFGDELVDILLRLQEDRAVRAILLSDAGGSLDAGMDLNTIAEERSRGGGMETMAAGLDTIRRVVTLMHEMGKPIVAAIRGDVRDAGFGLVMAADVRVACDTATFTLQDMRHGLLPDWGLTSTMPRLIGPNSTLELFWSGRSVPAEEAARMGLVDRVISGDVWEDEVERFTRRLTQIPQPALQLSKMAVQQSPQFDMTTMLSLEFEAQQQCWDSLETVTGMTAMLNGDEPDFRFVTDEDEE